MPIFFSFFHNCSYMRFSPVDIIQQFSNIWAVQFSCSVMSNSLWPRGLQHARLPCPLPTPRVYPNPCALSQWCYPTISSSVVPFSSCLQGQESLFPASGSFPLSQFFHQMAKVLALNSFYLIGCLQYYNQEQQNWKWNLKSKCLGY